MGTPAQKTSSKLNLIDRMASLSPKQHLIKLIGLVVLFCLGHQAMAQSDDVALFRIQIGAYTNHQVVPPFDKHEVQCNHEDDGLLHCYFGNYESYAAARESLNQLHERGMETAFIVKFVNDRRVAVTAVDRKSD